MEDSSSALSSSGTPVAPAKGVGLFESALHALFSRRAHVDSIETLNPKFRLITLRGDALKDVRWTPGDKVQIQLGGWIQRTYTPLEWDSKNGLARILVYIHADGPGTGWARNLCVGDLCTLFGPRRSIDLAQLRRPAVFFGDETTFGLAQALRSTPRQIEGVEFVFEISTPTESLQALEQLGFRSSHHCVHDSSESHLLELENCLTTLVDSHHPLEFVFAGRSTAIRALQQGLRRKGIRPSQFHTRAYWTPGKTGLE